MLRRRKSAEFEVAQIIDRKDQRNMSGPTPIERLKAGHEANQAAQEQRRKERQQLAYEEPETTEQQLERLWAKAQADPAWYDAQPPTLKISLGHFYRNKLRAEALLGKPNENDTTGDQK
jgi:hypothetical protein